MDVEHLTFEELLEYQSDNREFNCLKNKILKELDFSYMGAGGDGARKVGYEYIELQEQNEELNNYIDRLEAALYFMENGTEGEYTQSKQEGN